MKHVVIAIPAYTGTIHLGTVRSLFADMLTLIRRGDRFTLLDECGNAMIGDGRALIVAKFLDTEGTDLVFVDADIIWQEGALVRLVDAPVDFVAGIYPQRKDPLQYCVQYLPKKELQAAETGLLEVAGVPAGFMRCSRAMLDRMVKYYSDTEFYCETAPNNVAWALFDPWRDGKLKFGEDYSFCRRWRNIGGRVWINPEIKMGHVGYKTFVGSLGDWLINRSECNAVEAGKFTESDFVQYQDGNGAWKAASTSGRNRPEQGR